MIVENLHVASKLSALISDGRFDGLDIG